MWAVLLVALLAIVLLAIVWYGGFLAASDERRPKDDGDRAVYREEPDPASDEPQRPLRRITAAPPPALAGAPRGRPVNAPPSPTRRPAVGDTASAPAPTRERRGVAPPAAAAGDSASSGAPAQATAKRSGKPPPAQAAWSTDKPKDPAR